MDLLVLVGIIIVIIVAILLPIAIIFPRAIKKRNLVMHNNEINRLRQQYDEGVLTLEEFRNKIEELNQRYIK